MYIRRKVFSVALDENGEERLFSTNEVISEERMYTDLSTALGQVSLNNKQMKALAEKNNMGLVEFGKALKNAAKDKKALKKLGVTSEMTYKTNAQEMASRRVSNATKKRFANNEAKKVGTAKYTLSNAPRNVGTSARGRQAFETFQKYGDRIAKVERKLDAKKWAKRGGIGLAAAGAAGAAGYGAYRALKKKNND